MHGVKGHERNPFTSSIKVLSTCEEDSSSKSVWQVNGAREPSKRHFLLLMSLAVEVLDISG